MIQHATAVFERGLLRLIDPSVRFPEHSVIRLAIEEVRPVSRKEQLQMLLRVPVATELADAVEEARKKPWPAPEF